MTPTPMPCLTTSGPKAVKPAAGQETATVLITQDPPQSDQIDVLLTTPVKGEKKVLLHEHHKRHVEDFKKIFDENMKNKPVKHDKAFVFMWTWKPELDDLNVKEEVDELQKVFEDVYSFKVERQELTDPKRAVHELNVGLSTFMRNHDESNTLLIFYYAGHGIYKNNGVHFTPTSAQQTEKERKNNVAWKGAENCIRASESDVLVIFDCCAAGGFGGVDASMRSGPLPFQCLAACRHSERTRAPGKQSFTSALIWALKDIQRETPGQFTSNNLLAKVKEYEHLPSNQEPQLLKRDVYNTGLIWLGPLNLQAQAEYRNPTHEYIDLRLNFYNRVEQDDVKCVARHLSKLIQDDNTFNVKHVVLLNKTSTFYFAAAAFSQGIDRRRKDSLLSPVAQSPQTYRRRRTSSVTSHFAEVSEEVDITSADPGGLMPPTTALTREMANAVVSAALPGGAWFHFRMAWFCVLNNVTSCIEGLANRIRPYSESLPEPLNKDERRPLLKSPV